MNDGGLVESQSSVNPVPAARPRKYRLVSEKSQDDRAGYNAKCCAAMQKARDLAAMTSIKFLGTLEEYRDFRVKLSVERNAKPNLKTMRETLANLSK